MDNPENWNRLNNEFFRVIFQMELNMDTTENINPCDMVETQQGCSTQRTALKPYSH